MSRPPRQHRAFTLIELLIILVVLVLATTFWANFRGQVMARQLETAALLIRSELLYAKSMSMQLAIPHQVAFQPRRVLVYEGDRQVHNQKLPGNIEIKETTFRSRLGRNRVKFGLNGAPSPGGSVTLRAPNGKEKKVVVAVVSGRIRIE